MPDGSPFGNLEDDHSVDGFSDEDAESVQDDEGPPYAMVGQDDISQKEEQEEKKSSDENHQADKTNHCTRESCKPLRL